MLSLPGHHFFRPARGDCLFRDTIFYGSFTDDLSTEVDKAEGYVAGRGRLKGEVVVIMKEMGYICCMLLSFVLLLFSRKECCVYEELF